MEKISIEVLVNAPLAEVWDCWSEPSHITQWYFASDDWEAPDAENDLRVGGSFRTRMQAKDGSAGFNLAGSYTAVKPSALIEYELEDGRQVKTEFVEVADGVRVTQTFDPELENPPEMQRDGWQAILDNFKKYVVGG